MSAGSSAGEGSRSITIQSGQYAVQRVERPGRYGPNDLDWHGSTQTETLSGVLRYGIGFLQRHWWLLALGVLLGALLAPASVMLSPAKYVAETTIMFDTGKIQIFQQPSVVEASEGLDDQIQIIKSELIARKVLQALGPLTEEEFKVPEKGRVERIFGKEVASLLGLARERTESYRERYRLETLESNLTVRRVPSTRAISISYQSSNAANAAIVANTVASTYLHATLDDKRDMNRRTTDWLRERLSDLKQQAAAAQGAVNAFKASNSLLEGTGQHLIETRFAELNRELAVERSRLSELTARLSRVENVIREYSMAEVKPALSEFMNNALTSKLREQLYELSNRKENWSKKYSNDHEAVRNLQRRINEIHVALLHEHHRLAESYRSDIDISRRKEKLIQTTLDEVSNQLQAAHKARIRLRELESTAQTTQTLYDGLLKRQSEATEQETFPIARGRVLNEAVEPIGKNYRKTLRMAMILAMLGIAFGCAGALLRELSDNTFRSLSDVEQILGAPLLAVVGQWKRGQAPIELSRRSLAQGEIAKGNVARREGFFGRSEREMRKSQVTEAFMMLKHHVEEHVERHGKVVGITSGQPGEGASTIAASLASTMAANGTRTLLIDCDLRNPALSRMLAPAATTGLVDLLRGEAELADVLRIEPVTGLHFIPAASTVGERSIELLSSPAMQALMEAARRDYDCVMVDLASLVPLVDVLKMAPYVDGYVSIVAWGYSQKETTQRAYERLPHFQNRLIGVVLNKVDMARIHHYDYSASQWFDTKRYQNYMTLKSA